MVARVKQGLLVSVEGLVVEIPSLNYNVAALDAAKLIHPSPP